MRSISSRLHTCELSSYVQSLKIIGLVHCFCRLPHSKSILVDSVNNILKQLVCDYVPLTRPRRNYKHPLPLCVRASVLRKRRLWRKWRTNSTAENKREFIQRQDGAAKLCMNIMYSKRKACCAMVLRNFFAIFIIICIQGAAIYCFKVPMVSSKARAT